MYLLVGDTHLTDRPRDAYRFGIFDQIAKWQAKYTPDRTFIMGDLCDQKDKHSSKLVNRIVSELSKLQNVRILMGNHDYIDRETPYFQFLSKLENIHFIDKPFLSGGVCAVPHCRSQQELDDSFKEFQKHSGIKIVLLHNTFTGAVSETGTALSGLIYRNEWPRPTYGVYAGDVHKPQHAGVVTYVGAPYHIRFGDDYEPRCILIGAGRDGDLMTDFPRKWKLNIQHVDEILADDKLAHGDQVKVTVNLFREEISEWREIKKGIADACWAKGLEVFGIKMKVDTPKGKKRDVKLSQSPSEIVASYCKAEGIASDYKKAGLKLIEG